MHTWYWSSLGVMCGTAALSAPRPEDTAAEAVLASWEVRGPRMGMDERGRGADQEGEGEEGGSLRACI